MEKEMKYYVAKVKSPVKYVRVLPSELSSLNDDEMVVVNRVRLNSKLLRLEMNAKKNSEHITKLYEAINRMIKKERTIDLMVPGGEMAVGDIKIIFNDLSNMPRNSFMKITRKESIKKYREEMSLTQSSHL